MTSTPFTIAVSDDDVEDLRLRIVRTRWARDLGAPGWAAGTRASELLRLAEYWADGYDWRHHEAELNTLPAATAKVAGESVHYLRFDAEDPAALPLILTHGWPSTFLELTRLAHRLARPGEFGRNAPAFTVIVPSLPGFAFSAARPVFPTDVPTHELWHLLMTVELGFERYGAHGGDLGAGVTTRLGQAHPESVVGIHVLAVEPPLEVDNARVTPAEQAYLDEEVAWNANDGAYQHQQQTRPMSLAPGLSDSPVGLLAWILEKYHAWTDGEGAGLPASFDDDFVLTQASLYWFTNTISSSFRPYFEHGRGLSVPVTRIDVPTAVAVFPADLGRPPREWAERTYNVTQYTEMPRGGHFAAREEPDLLADDIRSFFGPLKQAR